MFIGNGIRGKSITFRVAFLHNDWTYLLKLVCWSVFIPSSVSHLLFAIVLWPTFIGYNSVVLLTEGDIYLDFL